MDVVLHACGGSRYLNFIIKHIKRDSSLEA